MDLGLGRCICIVLRQHSRIDFLCCSISLHLKRSSGDLSLQCQSAMTSNKGQRILQDLSLQAAITTLLKRGRGDYRTLPCSVSEQLKTRAERHGRPELCPVGLDS